MNFVLSAVPLPIRFRPETPMTDDDLVSFSSANDALRIEREPNGDLTVTTPADTASGGRNFEISLELGIWARRDGRGKVFDSSTGFTLPDGSVRSPDASWVLLSRWNALTKQQQRGFAPICPEFVIELRSPRDRLSRCGRRCSSGSQMGCREDG